MGLCADDGGACVLTGNIIVRGNAASYGGAAAIIAAVVLILDDGADGPPFFTAVQRNAPGGRGVTKVVLVDGLMKDA